MDLKGGGIDGCEVETIYPVNTVTAKTAHLITIYLFQTPAEGRLLLQAAVPGRIAGQSCGRALLLGMSCGGGPVLARRAPTNQRTFCE